MVDTINPNTNQNTTPSSADNNPQPAGHSFYSGFGRPDDVKVNLAKDNNGQLPVEPTLPSPDIPPVSPTYPQASTEPVPPSVVTPITVPMESAAQTPPPSAPKISDLQSKPETTYQTAFVPQEAKESINWRGPLVIVAGGVLVVALLGGITYFIANSTNQKAIQKQATELNDVNKKLNALLENPTPLELPKTETPQTVAPTPEAPKVETPAPAIEQPKIQEPAPATPDSGSG